MVHELGKQADSGGLEIVKVPYITLGYGTLKIKNKQYFSSFSSHFILNK